MATQFKVWVDSPDDTASGNVMSQSDFASDSQRTSGYASGQTISSKRLNTILRQTSLVMVALMDQFCPSSTATLMSSLATVKTALGNAIATKSSVDALEKIVTFQGNQLSTLRNKVNHVVGSSSETIPEIVTRVTNIENGTTVVPNATNAVNATNATNDADGNAIKSTYGASLDVSDATITLIAKDGSQLSSKTINNVANASQATKLGNSNVGTSKKFIYLVGGTPTATSETIGSASKPIYMSNGELKALTGNIGNSNTPVYMSAGAITSTGKDLRKMMSTLDLDFGVGSSYRNIINFVVGSSYSISSLGVNAYFSVINAKFATFPDGAYPVEIQYNDVGMKYFSGVLTKYTVTFDTSNYELHYDLKMNSSDNETQIVIRLIKTSENAYSINIARVYPHLFSTSQQSAAEISYICSNLYTYSTQSSKAVSKELTWIMN